MSRAKAAGKRFGRPPSLSQEKQQQVLSKLSAGASIASIAREFNTTRQTILRVRTSGVKKDA